MLLAIRNRCFEKLESSENSQKLTKYPTITSGGLFPPLSSFLVLCLSHYFAVSANFLPVIHAFRHTPSVRARFSLSGADMFELTAMILAEYSHYYDWYAFF